MAKLLCLFLLCLAAGVRSSADVMKQISLNFHKALEDCKAELNLPADIEKEFAAFWKEDNAAPNRDLGCTILCLANKIDVINPDGTLHHGNAKEFTMKHGADEKMAQQLIDLYHGCQQSVPANPDKCLKILDESKCFMTELKKLNWVPEMDVVVGEVLADA